MQLLPALADAGLKMLAHPVGHEELGVFWPTVMPFGQADLFLAQRFAVRRTGVLLVRCAIGDMTVDHDQGWPICSVFERGKGAFEHLYVVGVTHPRHVPAIADEPGGNVIAEG